MKHSHFAHFMHGMFLCTAHFVMHQVCRYCWYNDNSDDKCSGWEARWAESAPGLDTYLYLDHNYCDSLENLDTAPPRYLLSTNNDRPRADPDPSRRIYSHRAISRHSEWGLYLFYFYDISFNSIWRFSRLLPQYATAKLTISFIILFSSWASHQSIKGHLRALLIFFYFPTHQPPAPPLTFRCRYS